MNINKNITIDLSTDDIKQKMKKLKKLVLLKFRKMSMGHRMRDKIKIQTICKN